MNPWIESSINYATQQNYLDDLFQIYQTIPGELRAIDPAKWAEVQDAFNRKDNLALLKYLLKFDLFPIKDSYVAYFKRDKTAIDRNMITVERICNRLYAMGLDEIYKMARVAKETNRQMGPLFKRWLRTCALGVKPIKMTEFLATNDDAILDASDADMMQFAYKHLNYRHDKGLDFVARVKGKYVIGEAKFLTDFGGHQNAQFSDAISTLKAPDVDALIIAILDGVLYIKCESKMYKAITGELSNRNILSALVLGDFLRQL